VEAVDVEVEEELLEEEPESEEAESEEPELPEDPSLFPELPEEAEVVVALAVGVTPPESLLSSSLEHPETNRKVMIKKGIITEITRGICP